MDRGGNKKMSNYFKLTFVLAIIVSTFFLFGMFYYHKKHDSKTEDANAYAVSLGYVLISTYYYSKGLNQSIADGNGEDEFYVKNRIQEMTGAYDWGYGYE